MSELYPRRNEYEQIVISAPGPVAITRVQGEEEEIVLEEDLEEAARKAFNSALLVFMRALVASRIEPEDVHLNMQAFTREYIIENDGRAVVLEARLSKNLEVRVEANASKVRYVIVYPKRDRTARRAARRLEKALMEVLHEPLTHAP
ncbi:hypothetical protein Pyrfu_1772 [Pyrolobus fumarii 1A]|uniref:Uncharacterized protein n=1 Tax=Pyrolobus fumarii (strain DSM 11204 / 1A) TaxID=694429 RepID=G0ECQ6_PYRF1|nr:hypothetical protein [Pyrolobus fumarii]AEM39626.1 hypothetical protein Pyrfu_1772 [Pyrolobus fumarii 1A]